MSTKDRLARMCKERYAALKAEHPDIYQECLAIAVAVQVKHDISLACAAQIEKSCVALAYRCLGMSCNHLFESNPGLWDTQHRYCAKCGMAE